MEENKTRDGIVVRNRYVAYNYFSRENRQIYWAHLARDFERFADFICNFNR
jgi:hypothetical protein